VILHVQRQLGAIGQDFEQPRNGLSTLLLFRAGTGFCGQQIVGSELHTQVKT